MSNIISLHFKPWRIVDVTEVMGQIRVQVTVSARYWHEQRAKGQLGMLYGVDISNAIGAMRSDVKAYHPTVSDKARATGGYKTVILWYDVISGGYKSEKSWT